MRDHVSCSRLPSSRSLKDRMICLFSENSAVEGWTELQMSQFLGRAHGEEISHGLIQISNG